MIRKYNKRNNKKRIIKKCISQNIKLSEMRFIDTQISVGSLTGISTTLLNMPGYGTGNSTRLGDSITIHKIEYILTFHNEGSTSNYMRFFIFRNHGYLPTPIPQNYLGPGPSGGIDTSSFYVPYSNGQFFTVLMDKLLTTCPNGDTDIVKIRATINKKFNVSFVPGFTATVTNGLVFMAISDSVVIPSPRFELNLRIWYTN